MIGFDWFEESGVKNTLSFVYTIIDIIRIIVPIVLIIMTTIDIFKKVIDPNEKEGQKKIMYRAIGALIVFFVPTFINIVFNIMGVEIKNIPHGGGSSVVTPNSSIKPSPKPTLSSLSIENCSNNKKYYVGDTITLNSNIPNSFTGNIMWNVTDKSDAVIVGPNNKNNVKIIFLNEPKYPGAIYISLSADDKNDSCYITVLSFDEVKITNCPDKTNIFHVGDKFILKTNIPTTYKGPITWSKSNDVIKVIPISDNREVEVEILSVPTNKYIPIAISARGGQTSTTCGFKVE